MLMWESVPKQWTPITIVEDTSLNSEAAWVNWVILLAFLMLDKQTVFSVEIKTHSS